MKSSPAGQGHNLDQGSLPPYLPSASGGFHASARMRQRSALLWQQLTAESRRFSPIVNPPQPPDENIFFSHKRVINKKQKQNCVSLLRPYERTRSPSLVLGAGPHKQEGPIPTTLIYHSSIPFKVAS